MLSTFTRIRRNNTLLIDFCIIISLKKNGVSVIIGVLKLIVHVIGVILTDIVASIWTKHIDALFDVR